MCCNKTVDIKERELAIAAKLKQDNPEWVTVRLIRTPNFEQPYYTGKGNKNLTFGGSKLEKVVSLNQAAYLLNQGDAKGNWFELVNDDAQPVTDVAEAPAIDSDDSAEPDATPQPVVNATRATLALAVESELDINAVTGTGTDGVITVGDVRDYIARTNE